MSEGTEVRAPERLLLAALVALVSAPLVVWTTVGVLRSVASLAGDAPMVTGAALIVALAVAGAQWSLAHRHRAAPLLIGVLLAGVGGGVLGSLVVGVALAVVAVASAAAVAWLPERVPEALDGGLRRFPVWGAVVVVLSLASVAQTTRVSTFMGDPALPELQTLPPLEGFATHSCLTAYSRALDLAIEGADNLYDAHWWPALESGASSPEVEARFAPFDLDTFAYPPPFLLLARAGLVGTSDFADQRAVWFGLNTLFCLFGLWVMTQWIAPAHRPRPALAVPMVLLSPVLLVTLQIGNAHLTVTVMAALAMVAFDRGRLGVGGALLAMATLSKISPGILGIVLLARGEWRAAAWTAAWGVVLVAVSAAMFGVEPLQSFVTYQLPRLSSGEALAFLADDPAEIATNIAPFGIPFKLELLGAAFPDVWAAARFVGNAYTLLVVAAAVLVGRRGGDRRMQLCMWLGLLAMGALRSPFAPPYAMFGAVVMWLLVLPEVRTRWQAVGWVAVLLAFQGIPAMEPFAVSAAASLVGQIVAFGAVAWVLLRARPPRDAAEPRAAETLTS